MDDPALAKMLEFDQADLDANRAGHFSEGQIQHWRDQMKAGRNLGIGVGSFLLLCTLIGDYFLIGIGMRGQAGSAWAFLGAGLLSLIVGGSGILILRLNLPQPKPNFILQSVTGAIAIRTTQGMTNSHGQMFHHTEYKIHIPGHKFSVTPDVAHHLEQGGMYNIYFQKFNTGGETLLTLERCE
jgi:hypothetical protein